MVPCGLDTTSGVPGVPGVQGVHPRSPNLLSYSRLHEIEDAMMHMIEKLVDDCKVSIW